jgi:4-hydroxy-2-oxoheptanedioate aldolase
MTNGVRAAWEQGRSVINGWLAIPAAFSAEVMAQAGFDSLTVDLQHGVQDYASAIGCFQAIQAHGPVPLARVPWNEPGIIGKLLDAGAKGIICPMVNTAGQAAALVSACRYPPLGTRSFGPIRAGIYGAPADTDAANHDVLCLPMIETREALANLDAILDVPGVDGVYVGPADLGLSFGLGARQDREEPEILTAFARILAATEVRGQHAGVHCISGAYAAQMQDMGFRLVTLGNDSGLLLTAARAAIAAARG